MEAVIDYEVPMAPIPDESDVRPRCFGCDRPLTWVDEMNPRCECGCLLYHPIPTSEHI